MNVHPVNKPALLEQNRSQRTALAESSYRNEQSMILQVKELENEFTPEEIKVVDDLINTTLAISDECIDLEVLKKLQQASGIDSKCFLYADIGQSKGKKREFSGNELKLVLLEAMLTYKDIAPFIFKKLKLKYPLIRQALNRDVCQHGCEVWRELISRVCYTLDTNPKNLTDDQITTMIKEVNSRNQNASTMMYIDLEHITPDEFIDHFLTPGDLKEVRKKLKIIPKGRNYTDEELEKAQKFIAAGGGCAAPL